MPVAYISHKNGRFVSAMMQCLDHVATPEEVKHWGRLVDKFKADATAEGLDLHVVNSMREYLHFVEYLRSKANEQGLVWKREAGHGPRAKRPHPPHVGGDTHQHAREGGEAGTHAPR